MNATEALEKWKTEKKAYEFKGEHVTVIRLALERYWGLMLDRIGHEKVAEWEEDNIRIIQEALKVIE